MYQDLIYLDTLFMLQKWIFILLLNFIRNVYVLLSNQAISYNENHEKFCRFIVWIYKRSDYFFKPDLKKSKKSYSLFL